MSVQFAFKVTVQVIDALEIIHKKGCSYNNICPSNITFDNNMNLKLINFE
jgi:serine/threonine protein kinase